MGEGVEWMLLLRDLRAFYDFVSLIVLVHRAEGLRYATVPLLLAVRSYIHPRTLRVRGANSDWVLPARRILAGCGKQTTQRA